VLAAAQRCNFLLRLLDRVVDLLQFFLDFLRLAQIAVTGFQDRLLHRSLLLGLVFRGEPPVGFGKRRHDLGVTRLGRIVTKEVRFAPLSPRGGSARRETRDSPLNGSFPPFSYRARIARIMPLESPTIGSFSGASQNRNRAKSEKKEPHAGLYCRPSKCGPKASRKRARSGTAPVRRTRKDP
jgi:hypothetical protein